MIEIYKDIQGFEGKYKVSNLGNVKSLSKNKEKLLAQTDNGSRYLYVDLFKNNKRSRIYVHRLVAEAFIDNINNEPCINHIDKNRHNNKIDNLEWCSYKENNLYSNTNKALQDALSYKVLKVVNSKPVAIYASIRCAARCNNVSDASIIRAIKYKAACKGSKYEKFSTLEAIKVYDYNTIKKLLTNIINDL